MSFAVTARIAIARPDRSFGFLFKVAPAFFLMGP
jgi:hypothetical protein